MRYGAAMMPVRRFQHVRRTSRSLLSASKERCSVYYDDGFDVLMRWHDKVCGVYESVYVCILLSDSSVVNCDSFV